MIISQEEKIKEALEAIEKHELTKVEDIVLYTSYCLRTLYHNGLHELPDIKNAIKKNKIALKQRLRKKWEISDNPSLQLCLYKLNADPDELEVLNNKDNKQQKIEITVKTDKED